MGVEGESAERFELLTRPSCHLCDLMEAVLRHGLSPHGLTYRKVDVDGDEELKSLYGDTVPVLLADGREVARVSLRSADLERIVSGLDDAST
jgi:glutaredoxin